MTVILCDSDNVLIAIRSDPIFQISREYSEDSVRCEMEKWMIREYYDEGMDFVGCFSVKLLKNISGMVALALISIDNKTH
jgi:hypothetical protein